MTPYQLATRFLNEIKELPGTADNHPFIVWALMLAGLGAKQPDETPWCGAFVNVIAWLLGLTRPKGPAAARSWLTLPYAIALKDAKVGSDVVIIKRGPAPQPGPDVTSGATGHVFFFGGFDPVTQQITGLGGNQSNGVSLAHFPASDLLGIRRLA